MHSVLKQSYSELELLLIDDGSEDNIRELISSFSDNRIFYFHKKNSGVSDSRNFGLSKATGSYIHFLDADDILSDDFLSERVNFLQHHKQYDAVCSDVIKINENGASMNGTFHGAWNDVEKEVLIPDNLIVTCPSNYLFRKDTIDRYQIRFNPNLSSSADRYFLIEFNRFGKIGSIGAKGILYYRVHPFSMSNHLSIKLISDNLTYYKAVLKNNYIPPGLRKKFLFKYNYILAGGYFKLHMYSQFIKHAIRAMVNNPFQFLISLFRKNN